MGMFATRRRRNLHLVKDSEVSQNATARLGLPPRFEAVAEALMSRTSSVEACAVAGQQLAADGASVEEALGALRDTWQAVTGDEPHYEAVTALAGAWSEETLRYMGNLTCADPLTGLATHAHLSTCVRDLFRTQGVDAADGWAFVVCEVPSVRTNLGAECEYSLSLAVLAEQIRTVFPAEGHSGRVGARRVVAMVRRDERLGRRVRLLRLLLNNAPEEAADAAAQGEHERLTDADSTRVRVWIEALPHSEQAVVLLLDELAR